MDRPISDNVKKKRLFKQVLKTTLFVVLPLILVLLLSKVFIRKIYYDKLIVGVVSQGDLQATVSGSGVVTANYEELIGAPFRSKILKVLRQPGTKVRANDTILILDNESALNELERLNNELELMTIRLERQNLELRQKQQDFMFSKEIKELKIEGLDSELKSQSQLFKLGGTPKEMVIKAETDLKIAQLQLKQESVNHENGMNSRRSSLKELEAEIRIQKTKIRDQESVVSQAYVLAPFTGELSWVNNQTGVNVSEGQEIAKITDYSGYKIRGSVSNSWAGQIVGGQRVIIRDKQQDILGIVENIMPAVSNGMIEFIIRITGGDSSKLRPNQQLEIRVIVSEKEGVLLIPNGPYYTGRGYKELYVIKNGMAYRKKVLLGAANFDSVEIIEGLEPGEEVILSNLTEKYDREQIKIKQ